jgi:uncharacterized protein (DUF2147 family)
VRKKYCGREKRAENPGRSRRGCFFIGLVLLPLKFAQAQLSASPEGVWQTIDDHSGEPRALVRIYRKGDAYFGRVEASLVPTEADARCTACTDERKDQPVVGMIILRDLRPAADGGGFDGGDILDPESGAVYRCVLHVQEEGRTLNVRGYIGFSLFGRSQNWRRAE